MYRLVVEYFLDANECVTDAIQEIKLVCEEFNTSTALAGVAVETNSAEAQESKSHVAESRVEGSSHRRSVLISRMERRL